MLDHPSISCIIEVARKLLDDIGTLVISHNPQEYPNLVGYYTHDPITKKGRTSVTILKIPKNMMHLLIVPQN